MKKLIRLMSVIGLSIVMTGCASLYREVRYPGGASGYALDKKTFDASRSKQLQLYRATVLMALISRLGTSTVRNGNDANVFVEYLAATADEINYAGYNVFGLSGTDTDAKTCDLKKIYKRNEKSPENAQQAIKELKIAAGNINKAVNDIEKTVQEINKDTKSTTESVRQINIAANGVEPSAETLAKNVVNNKVCAVMGKQILFESDLPLIERRIFRLMIAALPEEQIEDFAQDAATGDVIGAAFTAVRVALNTVEGLRRAAAVYRTGLEGLAANLNNRCEGNLEYDYRTDTVYHARACLGLDEAGLSEAHLKELKGEDLAIDISIKTMDTIFAIAETSCASVPIVSTGTRAGDSLVERGNERDELCGAIKFKPAKRPTTTNKNGAVEEKTTTTETTTINKTKIRSGP